jgi:hypothetical protein
MYVFTAQCKDFEWGKNLNNDNQYFTRKENPCKTEYHKYYNLKGGYSLKLDDLL